MKLAKIVALLCAVCVLFTFVGCSKKDGNEGSKGVVTIRYGLWDPAQLPAYEKCAETFMAKNPNIKIEITQLGWDDYWTGLQTEMVGGTACDVFTDHLAKFKEFAEKNQILDLSTYIKRDNVDTSIYLNGLEKLWQTSDGKCYGLPKDWDTIAIAYNADYLKNAGITKEEANSLTWNYEDGGSFEQFIARLTLDENGRNGLDPNFDKTKIVQYGFVIGHSDDRGQCQYSSLTGSTGWTYTDGLYDSNYHYDDPRFIKSIEWLERMFDKGYFVPYAETGNGNAPLLNSGKAAATFDGSWTIGSYINDNPIPVEFALLPEGPAGRKSMTNGLGDSIWSGTKHPEEAWQWVKFLASEEAQKIVGSFGVVFPAIQSGVDLALDKYKSKGVDVSPFTIEASTPNGTFFYPVIDNASKVTEIMIRTFDAIALKSAEIEPALKAANKEVKALFK